MLFMENDGKILSHNAQINTAFFFPPSPRSQRDAKTEWDEGRERCGSEGATLGCREASPEDAG